MNYKPIILSGEYQEQSLIEVSASNIIIETVKPLEEKEKAFILRMYEAEGTYTNATLALPDWIKGIAITNMLEEQEEVLSLSREVELNFSAFEIKTIKINY
jgi:alpha-mannosidase